jgi:hypothetical protein
MIPRASKISYDNLQIYTCIVMNNTNELGVVVPEYII